MSQAGGPGGGPEEGQAGHGPAAAGVPGADECQASLGHGDRHLPEAAGGRGGQVRADVPSPSQLPGHAQELRLWRRPLGMKETKMQVELG